MRSPALIGLYTMFRKEVARIVRIWSQTLLPPVVTTTLYFAIFGAFIGAQVAPIEGYSYMAFIMPGLVMMSVITSAYTNTVSTFYFAKFQKNLDELLVSPMPDFAVIMGFVSGGVMRGLMVAVLITAVSLIFTKLHVFNGFIIFAAVFLTSLVFSFAGLVNGIFAKGFDAMSIIPTFVLTPLTYLGGVFYSIELLPEPFRTLSLFNPILYMVNAFRYGFLGVSDVNLYLAFGILTALLLIFFGVALWLFKRGHGFKN